VNPVENPELYDTYTLGGVTAPGVVTFSGHEDTTGWDVKQAKGNDGASTTRKGHEIKEFSASHYLVTDPLLGGFDADGGNIDDQAGTLWDEFAKLIESTVSGKEPKALDIYHPDLAAVGIKSVVKASIGGRTYDKKGGSTIVVRYLPYEPPKPKQASGPSGSASGSKSPPRSNADIALDELKGGFGPR